MGGEIPLAGSAGSGAKGVLLQSLAKRASAPRQNFPNFLPRRFCVKLNYIRLGNLNLDNTALRVDAPSYPAVIFLILLPLFMQTVLYASPFELSLMNM